jgi:hypothetical protein
MEENEMQTGQNGLFSNQIRENDCGSLKIERKELYIRDNPIKTDAEVMLSECEHGLEMQIEFENDIFSSNSLNKKMQVML